MKLLIIDEDVMFRKGIARVLSRITWITEIYETGRIPKALVIAADIRPEIILVNPKSDTVDMYAAFPQLRAIVPSVRFAVLSDSDDADLIFLAAKAGAMGYFLKTTPLREFEEQLFHIAKGRYGISNGLGPVLYERLLEEVKMECLTAQERVVYQYLKKRYTNSQIGEVLHISLFTVKNHVRSIMRKYDLKSRHQIHEQSKRRPVKS